MIQLKQNDKSKKDVYNIYIDDSSNSLGWAYRTDFDDFSYHYSVSGKYDCRALLNQTLHDFEPYSVITFNNLFDWIRRGHSILISNNEENSLEDILISFYFSPNLAYWNEEFTFAEYSNKFKELLEENSNTDYLISFEDEPALRVEFSVRKFSSPIVERIKKFKQEIKNAHERTLKIFREEFQTDVIQSIFNFPEEVKVFCRQYLEYFARFLQDLGINANSKLKEEAGKVLFSVTPIDDVEALDKIREALAVYLNLPASPISDIEYSENFALMRLQQQVRNLQHAQQMAKTEILSAQYALNLAQQNIDNQNQIIVQQNLTVENLNKIIEKITSKSIMTDSLDEKDKEDFEEICEGLRVGESKWLRELTGIGLSSGKFIKAIVKNTFGEDDEKQSVLGLNDNNQENI